MNTFCCRFAIRRVAALGHFSLFRWPATSDSLGVELRHSRGPEINDFGKAVRGGGITQATAQAALSFSRLLIGDYPNQGWRLPIGIVTGLIDRDLRLDSRREACRGLGAATIESR